MDRYRDIEAVEDLGGIEMFPDRTEDLRPETLLLPRQVQEKARDLGTPITRADAIRISHAKVCGDSTTYSALIAAAQENDPAPAATGSGEVDVHPSTHHLRRNEQ